MSVIEIIFGGALIILSIVIIIVTLMQSQKQQGMTSAVGGTNNDSFYGKNSGNTKEKALERLTKILAVLYFAIIIAINVINAFSE